MTMRQSLLSTTLAALFAPLAFGASSANSQTIQIDAEQVKAAQDGWEQLAPGVYQRIDAGSGAISTYTEGEAGRRYEQAQTRADLARTQQQLHNARQRGQDTTVLSDQFEALQARLAGLDAPKVGNTAKGSAFVYDESTFCHNVKGTFEVTFNAGPRKGGGTIGTVSNARVGTALCLGFECNPNDWSDNSFAGGTYVSASAANSGGSNGASQYSNGGLVTPMYNFPSATVSVNTPAVVDSACTLSAGGYVNSTLTTTPAQTCYLFRSFSASRTCAQLP